MSLQRVNLPAFLDSTSGIISLGFMIRFTSLGSGSAVNCTIIEFDDQVLMIDAGFSGKELQRRLDSAGIEFKGRLSGILVSHEHDDHVQALKVFSKRNDHPAVYCNSLTAERLSHIGKRPENIKLFSNGSRFQVGPFTIEAFSVSHDAVDPVGFIIEVAEKRIGFATDLGCIGKMVPLKLSNCELLMIESNHDPEMLRQSRRPPHLQHRILSRRGHLSNDLAAELASQSIGEKTSHLMLGHLSEDCNSYELAQDRMRQCLNDLRRDDINMTVARQDAPASPMILEL